MRPLTQFLSKSLILVAFIGTLNSGSFLSADDEANQAHIDLFPEGSFHLWERADGGAIDEVWGTTDDGWIHLHAPRGRTGSLVSLADYSDFELSAEWKVGSGVNNGIKYRVRSYGQRMLGIEYQILDVSAKATPLHQTGSIYDLFPVASESDELQLPAGEVNQSRIVVQGQRLEHWLNGVLVSHANVGSSAWTEAIAQSKHAQRAGFGADTSGRLMLTDHKGEIWFRNVRLKHLQAPESIKPNRYQWNLEKLTEAPNFRWLDDSSPIRSLAFENERMENEPTEVFAFYATPGTLVGDTSVDKDLPAVVLLHGGGGTAFAEWVQMWAKRGYAAIAMDLGGDRPEAPTFSATGDLLSTNKGRTQRTRMPKGGPADEHIQKFSNVSRPREEHWQYHSVAAAIRAHSLVRSFPEVDANRTALTGISWGGYLTCLVASIDNRFKAAVPVYGCGHLYDGESIQRPLIDALDPNQKQQWIRLYDPSSWLSECRVPMMFVNGTNDRHYPLASYARSYRLVPAQKQYRIDPSMGHSHALGWRPKEIGLFIDQHLKGTVPLPRLVEARKYLGLGTPTQAIAKLQSETDITLARLHFTSDSGPLLKRKWESMEARIGKTINSVLPDDARMWFFTATDSRGAMVSSEVVFEASDDGPESVVEPFVVYPDETKDYVRSLHTRRPMSGEPTNNKLGFREDYPGGFSAWQQDTREKLVELLGLNQITLSSSGFTPRLLGSEAPVQEEGYTRSLHRLETEPGVEIPFWVLIPKPDAEASQNIDEDSGKSEPSARCGLVICAHGHDWDGFNSYAGVYRDTKHHEETIRKDGDVGVQAVRNGYIAIVPATRGLARQTAIPDINSRHGKRDCRAQLIHCLLAGRTAVGERVWDTMRILDWAFQNLDNIDPDRVVMLGNSGGGVLTVYAAALDERIKVAISSCSFSSYTSSEGYVFHCDCCLVPRAQSELGDMSDVGALTAPRHLFAVHGPLDSLHSQADVERAMLRVHEIYSAAGAEDNFAFAWGDGGHKFYPRLMWQFIAKVLQNE